MTPREYLDLFRGRWRVMLAGLLLGMAGAVGVVQLSTPQYASKVTLFVSAGTSTDASAALDRNQLSVQRMQTYVQLATSESIAQDVAQHLKLDLTRDELVDKLAASAEPDTILLTVTVTDADPQLAADIANVLADRFISRVEEFEQPPAAQLEPPVGAAPGAPVVPGEPVVSARVLEQAVPSASPVSPRPLLTVALGALLGLLAGIALAVLRQALAPSITNRRQLADVAGAPVLGVVGRHRGHSQNPLVVRDDPRGSWAEAFRRLRANLQFVDVDRAYKIVMLTSPSSRDGTTTVLCDLACAMAETGQRVLVVEADLRRPRTADCFGVAQTVGLTNILASRARVEDVVQRANGGVDIVTSGPIPPNPGALLASSQMARFLTEVRPQYDVVLVDAAPVLPVADATVLAPLVDAVVLVVRLGTPAHRVEAARDTLQVVSTRLLGTVLTMARGRAGRGDERYVAAAPAASLAPTAPLTPLAPSPTAPATPATAPTGSRNGDADPRRPSPFPRTMPGESSTE
jgi:capsular exopolysaccharide synthesis family protein